MEIFNSVPPPPFVSMDLRLRVPRCSASGIRPARCELHGCQELNHNEPALSKRKTEISSLGAPSFPAFFHGIRILGGSVGGSLSLHLSHPDSEHDSEHDKKLSHAAHDVIFLTRPIRRDHDDIVIRLPPEGGAGVGRATFAGRKVCLLGP